MPSLKPPRFLIPDFRIIGGYRPVSKITPEELKRILDAPQKAPQPLIKKFTNELKHDHQIELDVRNIGTALNSHSNPILKNSALNCVAYLYNTKLINKKLTSLYNLESQQKSFIKKLKYKLDHTEDSQQKTQFQQMSSQVTAQLKNIQHSMNHWEKVQAQYIGYLNKEGALVSQITNLQQQRTDAIKKENPNLDEKTILEKMNKMDSEKTTLKEKLQAASSLTPDEIRIADQNANPAIHQNPDVHRNQDVSSQPTLRPSFFKSAKQRRLEKELAELQEKIQMIQENTEEMASRLSTSRLPKWTGASQQNEDESFRVSPSFRRK
jgi:hypothetical protein